MKKPNLSDSLNLGSDTTEETQPPFSKTKNKNKKPLLPCEPFRSAYTPRVKLTISFPQQGRTKQEFKNECDINTIMARFDKTGVLAFTNRFQPQYGDVTGIEFQTSMELIAHGRSMFQELPSGIRARFQNDPARFLDFVHDENNAEEMRAMGLLRPTDAQATPLPSNSETPPEALKRASKRGGPSELDRGAESGPSKSDPRGSEKTA
ncbi:MAG: internal scaffolding protein [Microvirus sp.]|nr:MAG: internal scaffolding protein [Microvirus sp.]